MSSLKDVAFVVHRAGTVDEILSLILAERSLEPLQSVSPRVAGEYRDTEVVDQKDPDVR